MGKMLKKTGVVFVLLLCITACSNQRKLKVLKSDQIGADISVINETVPIKVYDSLDYKPVEDRFAVVDIQGKVLIMNAVKDDESGEMIISDQLNPVVVEAKFRNVPERNGFVDIAFEIRVPEKMQSSDWQVRLEPKLVCLEDTMYLDQVYITGKRYREEQMRGYELYHKFLRSIIPDTCNFVETFTYQRLLDVFIARNFKKLAKLRTDSSLIESEHASSLFGVTEKEAIVHYTKQFLVKRNNRKKGAREKMYSKYVKVPLAKEGIRLDSVISASDGSVSYHYVQTIRVKKNLKKADMTMAGSIYQADKKIYVMPQTAPLTYYISSLVFLADHSVKYMKKIIERNARANTVAYIDFRTGEHRICDTLSNNGKEIGRIRSNIRELLSNKEYIIDSLIVTASCSPEGTYAFNEKLAKKRANAIKEYFQHYIQFYKDSVASSFWSIDLGGKGDDIEITEKKEEPDPIQVIDFIKTRAIAESWELLGKLLYNDTNIIDRKQVEECLLIADPDLREHTLSRTKSYSYIKNVLYPYLRRVKFDFYLHRKGMIKDTVHTSEVDTLYMRGLESLIARDYTTAIPLLRPYKDLNSAVAYICMDYNQSALAVLNNLKKSAHRDYLLAVVYARLHDEQHAIECFIHAVAQDPSMQHRGNLDPEISALIKKYGTDQLLQY